ncbi:MAG: hypothetical protein Ta2A_12380 [Treponemataceae bacterium]|nr:MAG: hypothetical protein Ta2A_12380 [Treponemataceae bacterium]
MRKQKRQKSIGLRSQNWHAQHGCCATTSGRVFAVSDSGAKTRGKHASERSVQGDVALASQAKYRYNFEWDLMKNLVNIEKHHVSFTDAETAFYDENKVIMTDTKHSDTENRFFCLGLVDDNVLTVRFTMREQNIRIFGRLLAIREKII